MRAVILGAILLVGLGATPAKALKGEELFLMCSDPSQSDFCMGYIQGMYDRLQHDKAARAIYSDPARNYPPPLSCDLAIAASTAGQIRDAIVQYLADNPDMRRWEAGDAGQLALAEAFGCSK